MTFLYLIRHPQTLPDPAIPASRWRLAPEGTAQVQKIVALPMWSHRGFAAIMAVDRNTLSPVTAFLTPPYDGLP